MPTRRKTCLFGWFLHARRNAEKYDNDAILVQSFRKVGSAVPDVTVYLPRMASSKSPELIRDHGVYKLERSFRISFDAKYRRASDDSGCYQSIG